MDGLPHSYPDIEQANSGYNPANEVYAQELTDAGIIQDETIVAPGMRPGHDDQDHPELDPDHHLDDQENASCPAGNSGAETHLATAACNRLDPDSSAAMPRVKA